jgi:hypothetical protein
MSNPFDMISSFFSPEKGYEAAENAAKQGWQEAQGFQKPYLEKGLEQYPLLQKYIQQLSNPQQMQNEWAQGYQSSPYAQRMLEMNKGQGLDAASAMGLMGSSGALQNIQQGAGDITSKDRQQYLNDLMQKYMSGIGLSSGIYNTGAGTAGNLGNQAMLHGQNMAGLEYGKTNAPGDLYGKIVGMIMGGATGGMGGGGGGFKFG